MASKVIDVVPLTKAQMEDLDRRDADPDEDIRRGRPIGVPWDQVLKQIRRRG